MGVKSVLGGCLRRMGYQAVRLQALPTINFAWHLRRLLTSQDIDTVFDVGANRGQYHDFLRKEVGYAGRILSFEPVAHLHRFLSQRAKNDAQWQIYPFALGKNAETLSINVMQGDDWSSFLQPQMEGAGRFSDLNEISAIESVNVQRLDDVFPDVARKHGIERCFLKLDTQGFDLNAMRGGASVLHEFVALQTEAVVIPYYVGMPRYPEVITYAEQQGFALSGMFPVSSDEHLRLIEFDCVMVNLKRISPA